MKYHDTACPSHLGPFHLWALHATLDGFEICMNCNRVRSIDKQLAPYPQMRKEQENEQR